MAMPPTTSPVAIQVSCAAAEVVAHLDVANVLQQHGFPGRVTSQDEVLQLLHVGTVQHRAELILAVGDFNRAAADLLVRGAQGIDHLAKRNAKGRKKRRKQLHLILLLESADRRDLGHPGDRLERGLDLIFVQQPQLAEIAATFAIDQCVLIDPAHAARVRVPASPRHRPATAGGAH